MHRQPRHHDRRDPHDTAAANCLTSTSANAGIKHGIAIRRHTATQAHKYTILHARSTPPWCTRSFSGAGSVKLSLSLHRCVLCRPPADIVVSYQASPHDYGNSASRCARSSTRSLSGYTPSLPALAAALATGSWAWSSDSSDCWPTEETLFLRSERDEGNAKGPPGTHRRQPLPRDASACIVAGLDFKSWAL